MKIDEREPLMATWQQYGAGQNWGLMFYSSLSLEVLQRHFRRFLQAKLPDGTIALFRFYDPRVFNTYIRAAEPGERAPWFDGVMQYSVEDENGTSRHQYRLISGQLLDGQQPLG